MISIRDAFRLLIDTFRNVVKRSAFVYVTENRWSTKKDGEEITSHLSIPSHCSTSPYGIRNAVVTYGSLNVSITDRGVRSPHPSNAAIATVFHIDPADPRNSLIPLLKGQVDMVCTSCSLTKQKLVSLGVPEQNCSVVPLGVDTQLFRPADDKKSLRRELGLPADKRIIGSFQKDGEGWEEGLVPKMVKGPDVFCESIARLKDKHDIHVLLTGPARGYVKRRLEKMGVGYTHIFLSDFTQLYKYFQCLDIYLVTSREEGGPKAVLEAPACGVPLITTDVGMVPDIHEHEQTAMVCPVEDVNSLVRSADRVLRDSELAHELSENGRELAQRHTWKHAAKQYEQLIRRLR